MASSSHYHHLRMSALPLSPVLFLLGTDTSRSFLQYPGSRRYGELAISLGASRLLQSHLASFWLLAFCSFPKVYLGVLRTHMES